MKTQAIMALLLSTITIVPAPDKEPVMEDHPALTLLQKAANLADSSHAQEALIHLIRTANNPQAFNSIEGFNSVSAANKKLIDACNLLNIAPALIDTIALSATYSSKKI